MRSAPSGRARSGRRAALTAVLLLAGVSAAVAAAPRSLLLISIDTLRADYLSCNGATRVRTPNLDRLAREGVNFTRARSPVPLTLPAHASLLTGNYPPTHGVRDNGGYRLPDGQLTLAEVLRQRGYRTAAFIGSFVLDRRFGLDQGFETYDDRVWKELDELESLAAERSAAEVAAAFEAWLESGLDARPFFVWIHLYDPHAPYAPPEAYRRQYPADPYAGEVAFSDEIVGRLLRALESRGQLAEALVAVVGDHGEGLGEHGEATHSLLIYNSTLHVPMLLRAPGLVAAGRTVDRLVRIVDLAPTLLDLLGAAPGLGEGVSLRALVERDGSPATKAPEIVAYSESLYPELQLGWSRLRGLETSDFRLILAPTPELFSLRDDPGERRNRIDELGVVYQRLRRQLASLVDSFEGADHDAEASRADLDEETATRLRALGYLSGPGRAPQSRAPADPKDKLEVWNRIQLGLSRYELGEFADAATAFAAVLSTDADIPLVYEYLADCWMKLDRPEDAEEVIRKALAAGLSTAGLHRELGRILLDRRQPAAAARELEIAVAADPRGAVAHYYLADALRAAGETRRAIEHYRRAVAINPDYLWAWNGLGMAQAAAGRAEPALEAFRRAVAVAPLEARGHFNLAVQLERMGRASEAVAAYRRFLELSEGSTDLTAEREQASRALQRLQKNW